MRSETLDEIKRIHKNTANVSYVIGVLTGIVIAVGVIKILRIAGLL